MINKNVKEKMLALKHSGFDNDEIRKNMRLQGFEIGDINSVFLSFEDEQPTKLNKLHPVLLNQFVPIVLFVLNYFLFFHFIPRSIASSFCTLFAIVGGIITLILCFWIFITSSLKLLEKFPIFFGVLSILSLFVFGAFFIYSISDWESNQLKENGKVATATVVDKTRIIGKRGHTACSIAVQFLSKNNRMEEATITINENEYGNFEEGMEVPILYSTENPNVAYIAYPQTLEQMGK